MTTIPAFTMERAVGRFRDQLEGRWREILDSQYFVGGEDVGSFEAGFAELLGAPACSGVANGTDALVLALHALGVRPGDEVVVPAFSFAATASTVAWVGATPVFADIDPATLNLDLSSLEPRLSERTVGVIGVHLYGRPFDVTGLREICDARGIWFIEDAAQAHGATVGDRRCGTFGELATWSFYPSKNLGCFGDGGAVTGRSAEAVERVRLLRNHGQTGRYRHSFLGTNSRLDSLQAAVLNCRLPLLEADNARRREIAALYRASLTGLGDLVLLDDAEGTTPVYHQMTVLTSRRDELQAFLAERGVGTAIHYPEPIHHQAPFADFAPPDEELPVSTRAAHQVLCLPMFPELTDAEVDRVCEAIGEFFSAA